MTAKVRIELAAQGYGVDVKRFYLPAKVYGICPICGAEGCTSLSDSYLGYPTIGEPEAVSITCQTEGCPFSLECFYVRVVLGITLDAVGEPVSYEDLKRIDPSA